MVSVCLPSDALLQHLPSYLGFSYLGVGYLFTAAPAKHSCYSLRWTRGISLPPDVQRGRAPLGPLAPAQPLLLGLLLPAAGPSLGLGGHEIKRHLLLGRKVMTNVDSIFKSRDITLLTKVRLVKAMVFPVVMYGCKSWTVKKAER